MNSSDVFEIVNGPNREELFDALRLKDKGFIIELRLESFSIALSFQVEGIASRDPVPGEKWDQGHFWKIKVCHHGSHTSLYHATVLEGSYNTKNRKGFLKKIF